MAMKADPTPSLPRVDQPPTNIWDDDKVTPITPQPQSHTFKINLKGVVKAENTGPETCSITVLGEPLHPADGLTIKRLIPDFTAEFEKLFAKQQLLNLLDD